MPNLLFGKMEEMNKKYENEGGFLGFLMPKINDIFGRKEFNENEADALRTNNKPIPFDEYTKKSITEVIPGYLSKILNSLKGFESVAGYTKQDEGDELLMDYKSGQFQTKKDMLGNYFNQKETKYVF